MHATTISLPNEIYDRLVALSAKTGRTTSFYIQEAVSEYIEDLEDIYISEQRLADLKAGRSRLYSSEEVEEMINAMDN